MGLFFINGAGIQCLGRPHQSKPKIDPTKIPVAAAVNSPRLLNAQEEPSAHASH